MQESTETLLREYSALRAEFEARLQAQQQIWLQILAVALSAMGAAIIADDKIRAHPVIVLLLPGLFGYLVGIWAWHDNTICTLARYISLDLRPAIVNGCETGDRMARALLWDRFKFAESSGIRRMLDGVLTLNRYGAALAGIAIPILYWVRITDWGRENTDRVSAVPLLAFDLAVLLVSSLIVAAVLRRWLSFGHALRQETLVRAAK